MVPDVSERQLRAALTALGITVPTALWQAAADDPKLRLAALWGLLWRTAGEGMQENTVGTGNDRGYLVGPHEWPLPEDQPARARAELEFATTRLEAMSATVAPWSIAVSTGYAEDEPVDGWAQTAAYAAEAAVYLIGPLACDQRSAAASKSFALNSASRNLDQATAYLTKLSEACGHPLEKD